MFWVFLMYYSFGYACVVVTKRVVAVVNATNIAVRKGHELPKSESETKNKTTKRTEHVEQEFAITFHSRDNQMKESDNLTMTKP